MFQSRTGTRNSNEPAIHTQNPGLRSWRRSAGLTSRNTNASGQEPEHRLLGQQPQARGERRRGQPDAARSSAFQETPETVQRRAPAEQKRRVDGHQQRQRRVAGRRRGQQRRPKAGLSPVQASREQVHPKQPQRAQQHGGQTHGKCGRTRDRGREAQSARPPSAVCCSSPNPTGGTNPSNTLRRGQDRAERRRRRRGGTAAVRRSATKSAAAIAGPQSLPPCGASKCSAGVASIESYPFSAGLQFRRDRHVRAAPTANRTALASQTDNCGPNAGAGQILAGHQQRVIDQQDRQETEKEHGHRVGRTAAHRDRDAQQSKAQAAKAVGPAPRALRLQAKQSRTDGPATPRCAGPQPACFRSRPRAVTAAPPPAAVRERSAARRCGKLERRARDDSPDTDPVRPGRRLGRTGPGSGTSPCPPHPTGPAGIRSARSWRPGPGPAAPAWPRPSRPAAGRAIPR